VVAVGVDENLHNGDGEEDNSEDEGEEEDAAEGLEGVPGFVAYPV
jgi:hypothetical protein